MILGEILSVLDTAVNSLHLTEDDLLRKEMEKYNAMKAVRGQTTSVINQLNGKLF